jgi:DNA-binding transcriptional regulator WhiA
MEITKENYDILKAQKLTRAMIAEQFGIPDWKLKKLIAKNGWGVARPTIKNNNIFSLEDESSYYWAGFIAADGNISDKNDLYICLHYDDTVMLTKILEYFMSNHKVSSNNEKYNRSQIGIRLSESAVTILRDKFNITPRKSLTYQLPNIANSDNFRHYLRGYFDGDGSICESFSNINSKTASLYANITGSKDFISQLQLVIQNKLGITGHNQIKETVSCLKYNTNDAKILLKYLYSDSTIYLPRKYNLYKHLVLEGFRKTR